MVASHLVKEKSQLVLLCAPGTSLGRCPPEGVVWVQQSTHTISWSWGEWALIGLSALQKTVSVEIKHTAQNLERKIVDILPCLL